MEPAMHLEQTTRLVLVLAHSLVREGMVRVLDGVQGVTVVADTGSAEEAIRLVSGYEPSLVIVDAELRSEDGIELVKQLKEACPQTAVAVIAERASPALVERALGGGASGFILKDVRIERFAEDIKRLGTGETVLHPDAASALATGYVAAAQGERPVARLTPRQREVLTLLAMGLENKQIARRLGIGVHTVKTHVSRVLAKLGASSRTEAVVVAMKERLIG